MDFHGRAAAHKSKITMCNAKRQLEGCQACRHWTLEQWKRILWSDESCLTTWTNLGLADAKPNHPTSVPDLTNARGRMEAIPHSNLPTSNANDFGIRCM